MDFFPEDLFETSINLNASEDFNSRKLDKSVLLSCFVEDHEDQIFNIKVVDDTDIHILQFKFPDWVQRREKEFTEKINNFNLLIETIKEAFEKKRLTLFKFYDSFMMTIFYTIIFKEEKISFELHQQSKDEEYEKKLIGKFYSESEPIDGRPDIDYRAELVEYNTNFEDCGDRSIIKIKVKNIGNCTWDRHDTSFRCVPEFSTLLCNEYFLTEDIIPGDEHEIELEFMKGDPDNLEPPYFTFLHLNVNYQNYEPMLILDFNNAFKEEKNKNILIRDKNQKMKKKIKKEKNSNKINQKKSEKDENEIILENKINEENNIKNEINIEEPKNKEIFEDKNEINIEEPKNKEIFEDKNKISIDLDDNKKNKNNFIFNNVKVNITFNVENNNKIICVDVNENKVNFDIDNNKINFVDNNKNKIYVEEKKPSKLIKKDVKKEENNIIENNPNNDQKKKTFRDRLKIFEKK